MILLSRMNKSTEDDFFKAGISYHKKKLYGEAKNYYEKTIKINSNHLDAYNNLGIVLKELGNFKKAAECFNHVLEINPENIYGHYNLGLVYKKLYKNQKAVLCFLKVVQINPKHYSAYNNLGIVFKDMGDLNKAKECYEKALKINPNHLNSYYNLGNTLFSLRDFKKAQNVYETALKLNPNDKYLSHMISSLSGKNQKNAPQEYIVNVFDNFANKFDDFLTKNLKYKVPEKLLKLLEKNPHVKKKFKSVVDIGCGTGLSGSIFRNISINLIGVDVSKKMLDKAKNKKIYDYLIQDEAVSYLNKTTKNFDLFISTDVFIYVGDLEEIFSIISLKSNPGAIFCFSVEKNTNEDFKLLKSARYSHSKKYIKHLADKYNFFINNCEETEIRFELNSSLLGYIFVLSKI